MNNSQSVTAAITHQVRSGRETGYEEWLKGIAAEARQFEGHLGANILRPQPDATPNYIIVLQFESSAHLETWLTSEVRNDWIERVQPLIQEQESIQVLTGLEAWFQLPQQSSSYKPPKRYKQAILVWVGVMIVSLLVSPWVAPLLAPMPRRLRAAIFVVISVSLLSFGIMPYLTRWFKGWLFR